MKKMICILLAFAVVLGISACGENNPAVTPGETVAPTATPEPDTREKVEVSALSGYTIIYPASYSEWKMTEVKLLKDVIKHITGKEIDSVPDTENVSGKKIILGSTSIETKYSATIDGFANAMCYVVGVDGDNVVLGGKNYYSDMRAIYDLVNNTLGYDDIKDEYTTPEKAIIGEKTVSWEKPEFYIMGANFASNPFTKAWQVKDVVDCGFNLLHLPDSSLSRPDGVSVLRDELKLCARFGIEGVIMPSEKLSYNKETKVLSLPDEEDIRENPAVFGMYVYDEPQPHKLENARNMLLSAKKRFGDLGWKFYIEVYSPWYPEQILGEDEEPFEMITNWRNYFSECDGLSLDFYFQHYSRRNIAYCYIVEQYAKLARELGQDFYFYTESYRFEKYNLNPSKIFRTNSFVGLCFGAKMIQYFNYGDASAADYIKNSEYYEEYHNNTLVNSDFEKTPYYDYAKRNNEELKKITDILNDYEYVGAYAEDPFADNITLIEDEYPDVKDLFDVTINPDNALVFGIYKEKDGDGYAIVMMNINELNNEDYDKTKNESFTLISFNTKNVKCYIDGEPYDLINTKDNIFEFPCGNGSCALITIG